VISELTRIPMARPTFGPEEEQAVLEVMRSGALAQGARVEAFETAFASATGARHAVATSNGTTALFLALKAHDIGPGDEVITSPMTFIATANAIAQTGAKPVFGDVDDSLNLDPAAAAALIGPKTRAIIPVHLHGNPADMKAFRGLAERHNLALIQDACQAVGALIDDQPLGRFGTAVYSFYATKNLTTGEGGMIITNDPEVGRRSASLRHQAYSTTPYLHDTIGYNYRMTEMQAAIGVVQLGKLDDITTSRRQIASFYDEAIEPDGLVRPRVAPGHLHVFHQYTLRARDEKTRDALRAGLDRAGITTGVYYPVPAHHQPPYLPLGNAPCPEAERAADDMFSIPVHPGLTDRDRDRVVEAMNDLIRRG
jgi:dTDP-4-amino-4,6-dideoxygalactose transaminase